MFGAILVGAPAWAAQGNGYSLPIHLARAGESWRIETLSTDGYTYGGTGLAIGPNGTLHLAYIGFESRDLMYAWKEVGEEWMTDQVDGDLRMAGYPSAVISPSGGIHITYCDCRAHLPSGEWTSRADLKHAWGSPGSWSQEVVDTGGITGQYATPLIATDGTLHIAFATAESVSLKHAWGKGPNAMEVETVEAGENGGWYATPVQTSDGSLHFIYMQRQVREPQHLAGEPGELWHAWESDGLWQRQRINLPTPANSWVAAVVSGDDTIHIAYGGFGGKTLRHAWGDERGWESEVVEEGLEGWYKSLAIGEDGVLHVAFWDSVIGALFHSWGSAGSWQTELVDEQERALGSFPSIAVAPNGFIHITYSDLNHGIVKHAWRTP
ncbi:hypothetical protein IIA16_04680 [bacterium]|nr:hypothetical protein [bacterium]